jgi:hypothetical protein
MPHHRANRHHLLLRSKGCTCIGQPHGDFCHALLDSYELLGHVSPWNSATRRGVLAWRQVAKFEGAIEANVHTTTLVMAADIFQAHEEAGEVRASAARQLTARLTHSQTAPESGSSPRPTAA